MTFWRRLFAMCFFLSAASLGESAGGMHSAASKAAASTKIRLCPELAEKSPFEVWATRFDNKTKACYKTGQRGPCGNQMIFYSLPDDPVHGSCDCNYDIECKSLIYSSVYEECFYAYSQGHCEEGYWLTANTYGLPACERNLCTPREKYSAKFQWAIYKGRCERLYKPNHDCKPDEYLWIPKGNRYPECGKADCTNPHSFVPELQCELGSRLYHEGRCVRKKGI